MCRDPLIMEYLPLGREPTSLNQETVASMFFFAKHWNEADWPKAIVLTAGVTTIPGAEITSAACPLNGWREVGVSEVGSPGSPFWPFIPGGPGSPGYPGGPWGPRGPTFPGGPCTQIWLLLVQIFFVTEWTDLLICCCISGVKTWLSPFGGVSAALGLLSFPEERRDWTFGGRSSVKLIHE